MPHPLETYLAALNGSRSTGAATPETSFYPALKNLLDEIGGTLDPEVSCVIQIENRGAGLPDGGLFTADQGRGGDANPMQGEVPARGVLEAKPPDHELGEIAESEQVERYLGRYGVVLVTNFRGFQLLGRDPNGKPVPEESYLLAENTESFWRLAEHPRRAANKQGERFLDYLKRVMLSNAPLSVPEDVAWLLASYAREGLARVERHSDLDALKTVRKALEHALGMRFTGDEGEHFFRSTLVQTIFYGVFSAWVLWHRESPGRTDEFDWRLAEWTLRVPFIRALYEHIATRSTLGRLGLVEVLGWATAALNRVDRSAFFQDFVDEQAVQYFYEPFLESFDPELRKKLGVWYTPPEIVQYQVARVDTVLREELDLADGLADSNVVVLDPCCGTGAYLVEVLKKIAGTLRAKDEDALIAADLKQAAMTRVFGFEILPSPFVVAHLQLGLMLHDLGAPLSVEEEERVGVYLTNALTGWEPPAEPQQTVLHFLAELQDEKDAAEHVKRDERVLVVLGNPPYNAFAGVSPEEEQGLVEPYKEGLNTAPEDGGWGIEKFNLDDLYVRFFRLAERRIAEITGRGVVSFISNHSWISEPSFVVLRKHLLDSFDRFWIENLHGNRKISEYAPDGRTSQTIFAIRGFSVGIRQGVATSLWVKTGTPCKGDEPAEVLFRDDLHEANAEDRRRQLLDSLTDSQFDSAYTKATPCPENRYSFRPEDVSAEYNAWPAVTELAAIRPFNGPVERRGRALISIDKEPLEFRMSRYFDPQVSDEEVEKIYASLMMTGNRIVGPAAREKILSEHSFDPNLIVKYPYKAFDVRWCYLSNLRPLFSEPSPQLLLQRFPGNAFFITRDTADKFPEGPPFYFSPLTCDYDCIAGHARHFPLFLMNGVRLHTRQHATLFDTLDGELEEGKPVANLSQRSRYYLKEIGVEDPNGDDAGLIWFHALAVGFSPAYLFENADGIRRHWPRVPLPDTRETLEESAALGRTVAALLDTETEAAGVTSGSLDSPFQAVGVLTKLGGGNLDPSAGDLAVTKGWGYLGARNATMPGKGHSVERDYEEAELDALEQAAQANALEMEDVLDLLGQKTFDVYLNDKAYWKNIPANVWEYYIGGYQVIKKWLSYRERQVLGRDLRSDEAREVTGISRRLTALTLLQPDLDANYRRVAGNAYEWPGTGSG